MLTTKKETKKEREEKEKKRTERDRHDLHKTLVTLQAALSEWKTALDAFAELFDPKVPPSEARRRLPAIKEKIRELTHTLYTLVRAQPDNHASWRNLEQLDDVRKRMWKRREEFLKALEQEDLHTAVRKLDTVDRNLQAIVAILLTARKYLTSIPQTRQSLESKIALDRASSYVELEDKWKEWLEGYKKKRFYEEKEENLTEHSLVELSRLFEKKVSTNKNK